jgi:hypothetical protein
MEKSNLMISKPIKENNFVLNNAKLDSNKTAFSSTYQSKGITYRSNDPAVVQRDEAGNVILLEGEKNQLLRIEPIATNITTTSMLKVLDTQFTYFKFPTTYPIETTLDLDLDIDINLDQDLNLELKLPVATDPKNQPNPWDRINTSYESDWFYGDILSSGFRELPFTGGTQPRVNAYTLTKSTIDELRRLDKTLKFTIQTQYVSTFTEGNTGFSLQLNRGNIKSYRPWLFPIPEIRTLATPTSAYPVLGFEFIVNADDLVEDDFYTLNVVSGNPAYSLNDAAYWKIEVVDIPDTPPLFGINDISGVYDIQGGGETVTLYSITDVQTEIGSKIPGTEQFIFRSN